MHQLLSMYISARLDSIELKRRIANYEQIIAENRALCSHFKMGQQENGMERRPIEGVLAIDFPERKSYLVDAEEEESSLNEKLTDLHKIKAEIPNFFQYRGCLTHESEGLVICFIFLPA